MKLLSCDTTLHQRIRFYEFFYQRAENAYEQQLQFQVELVISSSKDFTRTTHIFVACNKFSVWYPRAFYKSLYKSPSIKIRPSYNHALFSILSLLNFIIIRINSYSRPLCIRIFVIQVIIQITWAKSCGRTVETMNRVKTGGCRGWAKKREVEVSQHEGWTSNRATRWRNGVVRS